MSEIQVKSRFREVNPTFHGKELKWSATQWEFLNSKAEQACLFGAWGSGKTSPLWWKGLGESHEISDGWGFFGTDSGPALDRLIDEKILPLTPKELIVKFQIKAKRLLIRTCDGGVFTWQFMPYLEWEKIGGPDINIALGDEMSRCSVKSHRALVARARHPLSIRHPVYYATNNNGRDWLYKHFVQGNSGNTNPSLWWKASSTIENLHNLPKNYLEKFKNYPLNWWRRFVLGEFVEFTGSVFEIADSIHIIPRPRDNPRWTFVYIIDHGGSHPTVCQIWATDFESRLILLEEYWREGLKPRENAKEVARFLLPFKNYGLAGLYGYADPSMWNTVNGIKPMQAYIDEFEKVGLKIPIRAYRKKKVDTLTVKTDSAITVQTYLEPDNGHVHPLTGESPAPTIYFSDHCIKTIESMSDITWEDTASGGDRIKKIDGDDGADCVRYRVMNPLDTPEGGGMHGAPVSMRESQQIRQRQTRLEKATEEDEGMATMFEYCKKLDAAAQKDSESREGEPSEESYAPEDIYMPAGLR